MQDSRTLWSFRPPPPCDQVNANSYGAIPFLKRNLFHIALQRKMYMMRQGWKQNKVGVEMLGREGAAETTDTEKGHAWKMQRQSRHPLPQRPDIHTGSWGHRVKAISLTRHAAF